MQLCSTETENDSGAGKRGFGIYYNNIPSKQFTINNSNYFELQLIVWNSSVRSAYYNIIYIW